MDWTLDAQAALSDGVVRWQVFGDGGCPTVLVHGAPSSSFLWRGIAGGQAAFYRQYRQLAESDTADVDDHALASCRRPRNRVRSPRRTHSTKAASTSSTIAGTGLPPILVR